MQHFSQETRDCIDACLACASVCRSMAMTHCLETGGEHVRPQHFRLMIDCSDLCTTAAKLMENKSQFHKQLCRLCAEVCETCAGDCERLDGMEDCVKACRACAEHCSKMAAKLAEQLNV